jgi:hypothetical protein
MSYQAFNVVLFVADFVAALDRLQRCSGSRPAYPSVPWHRALREADTRRLIVERHAELDAVHQRVAYCERFYGSSMARMNGRLLRLASVEPEIPGTRGRHTEKRHI